MKHISSEFTRFLIRPAHVENESLRGYVSRVTHCNRASPLLITRRRSLQATTDAIQEIAALTECSYSVLKKHGSYTDLGPDGHPGVLFGDCIVPTNRVRMARRMICPKCVSENGISTCCWELRNYDVCHEHGCYLVGCCSGCEQFLSWFSTLSDTCSCGVRHANIQTEVAPTNRILICKLMGDAMLATVTRSTKEGGVFGPLTPLDWFFTVSNFVRSVLIPNFCREHLEFERPISDEACEELLIVILKDSAYFDHLRRVILVHAIGNSMSMAQPLRSGVFEKEIKECFRPCLEKVTPHSHLYKIKADVMTNKKLDFQVAPEFVSWAMEQWPESRRFQP